MRGPRGSRRVTCHTAPGPSSTRRALPHVRCHGTLDCCCGLGVDGRQEPPHPEHSSRRAGGRRRGPVQGAPAVCCCPGNCCNTLDCRGAGKAVVEEEKQPTRDQRAIAKETKGRYPPNSGSRKRAREARGSRPPYGAALRTRTGQNTIGPCHTRPPHSPATLAACSPRGARVVWYGMWRYGTW